MDSTNSSTKSNPIVLVVGSNGISPTAFYVLAWLFFALCTIVFLARIYVRYVCFRRLILEDYLMMLALMMHNVEAVLIQIYARYAFDMEAVQQGDLSLLTPDFFTNSEKALLGLGVCATLSMIGILIVKFNFLLFFRRIGINTGRRFIVAWWAAVIFTTGGAVVQLGIMGYGCNHSPAKYFFYSGTCTSAEGLRRTMIFSIFSAVQDALSDFLIIGFPTYILWRSEIEMRKKILLSLIFCLAFFTIAITIVRGSVFSKLWSDQAKGELMQQSASFTWFWFYTEFSVAILIACLVSFRSLFVNRNQKAKDRIQQQQRREAFLQSKARRQWQNKFLRLQNSVLDTCKDLEGVELDDSQAETLAMDVPSGLMTVDFNDDANWSRTVVTANQADSIPRLMEPSWSGHQSRCKA